MKAFILEFTTLILMSVLAYCLWTFDPFDDTEKPPSHEEFARVTEQCYGQRIGDPAFRFPYDISCAEWVKIKVGDNKYTQQWINDHIKTEKLAEEEWGN